MNELQWQSLQIKTKNLAMGLLDWILPPSCPGCGLEGELICDDCHSKIDRQVGRLCRYCGQPVRGSDVCGPCRGIEHAYEAYRGYGFYAGVLRDAIIRLKYENDIGISRVLAGYLETVVRSTNWHYDIIVPVPLSAQKLAERGYNQASRLAKPLAAVLEKPFRPLALTRIRETSSQVGLDIRSRLDNVNNAFRADPRVVKGKSVLLVDDVFTTGATLQSTASELKIAGASQVFALTLAKSSHLVKNFE